MGQVSLRNWYMSHSADCALAMFSVAAQLTTIQNSRREDLFLLLAY
jgi:hypothetical protein